MTDADSFNVERFKRARRSAPKIPPALDLPDQVLIERLVEYGQPRHDAIAMVRSSLRLTALLFYVDTLDADRGDKAAKDRVDLVREGWAAMNKRKTPGPLRGV